MDALFVPLANLAGASLDQIKVSSPLFLTTTGSILTHDQLISCLLISYPLGSVFIRIPNDSPNLKHLFSLAIAVFYLIPVLHLWTGFLQLLLDVVGTYLIARNVKNSHMPWIVFAYVITDMSILHGCIHAEFILLDLLWVISQSSVLFVFFPVYERSY